MKDTLSSFSRKLVSENKLIGFSKFKISIGSSIGSSES
jgi:hypothetical protein